MEHAGQQSSHKKTFKQKFLSHKIFQKNNLVLLLTITFLSVSTAVAFVLSMQPTQLTTRANTTSLTIPAFEDSFVSQSSPTKNYGKDASLKVDLDKTSYLKFNLASLAGQPVTNAVLRLYVTNDSGSTQEIKEVIDSSWGETAVTFDNQPVRGPRVLGQINGTTINTWKEIDVTSFIIEKAGQTITLGVDASGANSNNLYVGSRESSTIPVLGVQTGS